VSALPGIVRWVKPGSMGVQFGLLGARETYAITEMLADSVPPAG
jgi:type IV pilus assembly protein PilZ